MLFESFVVIPFHQQQPKGIAAIDCQFARQGSPNASNDFGGGRCLKIVVRSANHDYRTPREFFEVISISALLLKIQNPVWQGGHTFPAGNVKEHFPVAFPILRV